MSKTKPPLLSLAIALTGLVLSVVAAGCGPLEELAKEIHDHQQGTNPPSDEQPAPSPGDCRTDSDCGAGRACNFDAGLCSTSCAPGQACPTVCLRIGVCEDQKAPPPADRCHSDADCKTNANTCGGCACEAHLADAAWTTGCPAADLVQCFVDPCRDYIAVCSADGQCLLSQAETGPIP